MSSPVISVGVLVERRKAASQWVDFVWQPVGVLPGMPGAEPWTVVKETADTTTFYVGHANVTLHHTDTANYRDNLSTGEPKLWVVLRPTESEPPYMIACVTADGSEGEGFTAAGNDIVESVPMPETIRDAVEAFIAEHHVERPFFKRTRNRADPEALGRRGRVDESDK